MKFTQEQIDTKLKEIQNSIPEELLTFDNQYQYPTVHKVIEAALESPDVTNEKKEILQRFKNMGLFDKSFQVLAEDKQKKIDEYLKIKIETAIKNGELPPASQSPFVKSLRKKWMKK